MYPRSGGHVPAVGTDLDLLFVVSFKRLKQESPEDGVSDDHGGESDVWEEECDHSLAAADDRLTSSST